MSRSLIQITLADLRRLGALAAADRTDLFRRKSDLARHYADRLFAVALCQGAALHFIDGTNGVKDFDVWSFFRQDPERSFPCRRAKKIDFGDAKFGTTDDSPEYIGRRVDLIGRSMVDVDRADPVSALRRYLRGGRTVTAKALARKAMVLIEPAVLVGTVVWLGGAGPIGSDTPGSSFRRC